MDKERETIILKTDDIEVTPRQVAIGSKTYDISQIKSVTLNERTMSPSRGIAVRIASFLSLLLGIFFCLATFAIRFIQMPEFVSDWPRINLHFLFAGIGLLLMTLWSIGLEAIQPTYSVQIVTEAETFTILESKEKVHIKRVVKAINEAIAHHRK
jgi:hypothetical protein